MHRSSLGSAILLLSGFALGYAFNTRPLSAVVFGVVGAGLTVYHLFTQLQHRQVLLATIKRFGFFFIPFVVMLSVYAWRGTHISRKIRSCSHTRLRSPTIKSDSVARTEGYEPNIEQARIFTPAWAIERTWRHILPCISFNALGWGSYQPQFVEGGCVVIDVDHCLCTINSAVVSATCSLFPLFT